MKIEKIIMPTLVLLIAILFISVFPTEEEYGIYEDTVRLHILANSDSKEDQSLKLKIRDRLLEKYSSSLMGYDSKEEAEDALSVMIPSITEDVNGWIADEGYNYESRISISSEWYDTRVYEEYTLPQGYYTSLVVSIGDGDGQNWWCVMYPPLCLGVAVEGDTLTDEEYDLIRRGQCSYKFKILELLSREFRNNA